MFSPILLFDTTRMLSLNKDLMKKYQKELRTNTAQVEQITTLNVCLLFRENGDSVYFVISSEST